MRTRTVLSTIGLVSLLALPASPAGATTWDFWAPADPPVAFVPAGSQTFVSGGVSVTASAWTLNPGYTAQTLVKRNLAPDDLGLGVCPDSSCITGDTLEIDNNGGSYQDVVRLDFGAIANLINVGLSSLDNGGGIDDFQIFGSNLPQPTLADDGLTVFRLAFGNETSTGNIDPTVPLSGSYQYLFVTTGAGTDNDFHLRSVSATVVPEPGTLLLLGSGLAGMTGRAWLKRHKR